jgi:polysaccharide export outer membrane protein
MPLNPQKALRQLLISAGLALVIFGSSCTVQKQLPYFHEVGDETVINKYPAVESAIQKGDLLSIIVTSLNPEASAMFNAPNESTPITSSATSGSNTLTVGYLVNQNGDIQFPILGTLHVAGMDKQQLSTLITGQIKERKLLVEPIVTIRFLNFRVTVMGEVLRPGVYGTQNEKLSLLEALGLAGDITIYGKRDNVMLIRENDKGERLVKRFDLTNKNFLESPFYYLHSNDIIVVEGSDARVKRERTAQVIPIILSIVSLLIVASYRIK